MASRRARFGALCVAATLASCGRLGYPPGENLGRNPCVWRAPELIPRLGTESDEQDVTLSQDDRHICFASNRDGDPDIYCADRASSAAPFRDVSVQAALRTTAVERTPALSPDHLELFFSSDRAGGAGEADLYVAHWNDALGEFDDVERIVELATAASEAGPALGADGLDLYFHRRTAAGRSVIMRAHRDAIGGAFTVIGPVDGIGAETGDDLEPTISIDGRLMVFCSSRDAPGTPAGTFSLWCSPSVGGAWSAPQPVEVPGLVRVGACSPELGPDDALYFDTASLAEGAGARDIFGAER